MHLRLGLLNADNIGALAREPGKESFPGCRPDTIKIRAYDSHTGGRSCLCDVFCSLVLRIW
jgi:hypothetical protein